MRKLRNRMITLEQLEARLEELHREREKVRLVLMAHDGAIREVLRWIGVLESQEARPHMQPLSPED